MENISSNEEKTSLKTKDLYSLIIKFRMNKIIVHFPKINQNIFTLSPQKIIVDRFLINPDLSSMSNQKDLEDNDLCSSTQSQKKFNSISTESHSQHSNTNLSEKKMEISKKFCKCSKTNCLRMYCSCFKTGMICSDQCGCKDCYNIPQHENIRQLAIKKSKTILGTAFENQIIQIEGVKVYKYGCECKLSCQQLNCFCKKNGVVCSPACICFNCQNNKFYPQNQTLQHVSKRNIRRKFRIENLEDLKLSQEMKNKENFRIKI